MKRLVVLVALLLFLPVIVASPRIIFSNELLANQLEYKLVGESRWVRAELLPLELFSVSEIANKSGFEKENLCFSFKSLEEKELIKFSQDRDLFIYVGEKRVGLELSLLCTGDSMDSTQFSRVQISESDKAHFKNCVPFESNKKYCMFFFSDKEDLNYALSIPAITGSFEELEKVAIEKKQASEVRSFASLLVLSLWILSIPAACAILWFLKKPNKLVLFIIAICWIVLNAIFLSSIRF